MLRDIVPHLLLAASVASIAIAASLRATAADHETISGPFAHENLAIYFVHGKSAEGPVPLTLEEALGTGAVKVHETGSVGELEIENVGEEEVLVHAGDIVKGGQQDRVVTATLLMKAKSGRMPLSVFCVEQGRWSRRGEEDVKAFQSADEMLPSRKAKLAMKSVGPVATASAPADPEETAAQSVLADQSEQRRAAGGAADPQGAIWESVGEIQAALSASVGATVSSARSETSLQLALENEKLASAQQAFIDALKPKGEADGGIIGYAFAINGKINSADIYASNGLFRKLWPRLVKAAATEAIGARSDADPAAVPDISAVEGFLASPAGGKLKEEAPLAGITLSTRDAGAAIEFETRQASGKLLHRNILSRE